jgi:arginase family enzyme
MLENHLSPVTTLSLHDLQKNQMGKTIPIYTGVFPELDGISIAIVGMDEEVDVNPSDHIRQRFYQLYNWKKSTIVADLGNINPSDENMSKTQALQEVITELLEKGIVPIIIGGTNEIAMGQYRGYEPRKEEITVVDFNEKINLSEEDDSLLLNKMLDHKPNYLFNFIQVGYQSYLIDPEHMKSLDRMSFEYYRLGNIRAKMDDVEPIVRDADMLSFGMSCMRMADSPGVKAASPNGFYAEEACKITRYAGMSDKLSSVSFYEVDPTRDNRDQTAQLVAQMMWYFIDGFYNRKKDLPDLDGEDYVKYTVHFKQGDHELTFVKSKKTDRWWLVSPFDGKDERFERHLFLPCSYADYEMACNDEVPERWMRAYEKVL